MSHLVLLQGNAQHLPLAEASVHVVCTSPPYFGLRVYDGLEPSAWPGGRYAPVPGAPMIEVPAWVGCLGNEPEPHGYVWHTLLWLREAWRVLRDDGVLWLNLGDSYAGGGPHHGTTNEGKSGTNRGSASGQDRHPPHYPQGTLLGIPQQVMLAAMADGWIVRNDCIWQKVAPMPESIHGWQWQQPACTCVTTVATYTQGFVGQSISGGGQRDTHGGGLAATPYRQADSACLTCYGTGRTGEPVVRRGSWRHTRAHEVVLMLTKQMAYWSDGEAVREEGSPGTHARFGATGSPHTTGMKHSASHGGSKPTAWAQAQVTGRNPRSVLTPAPSVLGLEHYASFPPTLIAPLITATCPAHCCPVCQQGYAPVLHDTGQPDPSHNGSRFDAGKSAHHGHVQQGERTRTVSEGALRPTCSCAIDLPPVPGICLDPFAGASTTLLVARALGRHAVGIEASAVYTRLSRERLGLTALDAWQYGAPAPATRLDDLPLFAASDARGE